MRSLFIFALVFGAFPLLSQPKSFSFVFLNKKTDAVQLSKEESEKIMGGHMANINRLAKEGKLISAGPFEGGGGIFILNTTSVDEAKRWLDTDPGVKADRWNIEILPYAPHIRSACAVKEPYEMLLYQFIRYRSSDKKVATDFIGSMQQTGNIITAGFFGDREGIVVLREKVAKEILEADPTVKSGHLTMDIKDLYIAKGSFCE